jgi:hypothetical protein
MHAAQRVEPLCDLLARACAGLVDLPLVLELHDPMLQRAQMHVREGIVMMVMMMVEPVVLAHRPLAAMRSMARTDAQVVRELLQPRRARRRGLTAVRSLLASSMAVALLFGAAPAHAQIASVEVLRARAAERGWSRSSAPRNGTTIETWCAQSPCDEQDRYELTITGGALTQLRLVLHDAADGMMLDAQWQTGDTFSFSFGDDPERSVVLAWELGFEPPGLAVGFTARDLDEMVAMDPSDGTHAFALWMTRELARQFASATSLRDTALAQRAALRRAVVRGLAGAGTVRDGTFADCFEERADPSGATGFFDRCPLRRATEAERDAAIATLDARLRRERALLRAHYRAFHRVLVEMLGAPPP